MRPKNVLTVVTAKGGTGKTTLTANLVCELAARGQHVLAIDADCNKNLTQALGQLDNTPERYFADLLTGMFPSESLDRAIVPCELPQLELEENPQPRDLRRRQEVRLRCEALEDRLWIAPGATNMTSTNNFLASQGIGAYYYFQKLVETLSMPFDWVVVDTPGAEFAMSVLNACIVGSDGTISVVRPGTFEYGQVESTEGLIDAMESLTGSQIKRWGYIISQFEANTKQSKDMEAWMEDAEPNLLGTIRKATELGVANGEGVPFVLQHPDDELIEPVHRIVDQLLGSYEIAKAA